LGLLFAALLPRRDVVANLKVVAWRGHSNEEEAMSAPSVQDLNRQLAQSINEEVRADPQSRYANKFVGIANGQVVVIANDLDSMLRDLRQIEPDPSKTFGLEANEDPNEVHEIWGLC
jgi:hypothetical protein